MFSVINLHKSYVDNKTLTISDEDGNELVLQSINANYGLLKELLDECLMDYLKTEKRNDWYVTECTYEYKSDALRITVYNCMVEIEARYDGPYVSVNTITELINVCREYAFLNIDVVEVIRLWEILRGNV